MSLQHEKYKYSHLYAYFRGLFMTLFILWLITQILTICTTTLTPPLGYFNFNRLALKKLLKFSGEPKCVYVAKNFLILYVRVKEHTHVFFSLEKGLYLTFWREFYVIQSSITIALGVFAITYLQTTHLCRRPALLWCQAHTCGWKDVWKPFSECLWYSFWC